MMIFSNSALFSLNYMEASDSYNLSLHDALPILSGGHVMLVEGTPGGTGAAGSLADRVRGPAAVLRRLASVGTADSLQDALQRDRKSTRLNSSHVKISYAVFCLKKKTNEQSCKVQ